MNKLIETELVNETIDAYVDWREERASVWDAYERWTCALPKDAVFAFAAYQAALDREERAGDVYADLTTRMAAALPAPEAIPAHAEYVRP
jgi:hypothetical protein